MLLKQNYSLILKCMSICPYERVTHDFLDSYFDKCVIFVKIPLTNEDLCYYSILLLDAMVLVNL